MGEYTSPLAWEDSKDWERSSAYTPFGGYWVENTHGEIRWGYCFDEYYDEASFDCVSIDVGKKLAQADWDKRVQPILKTRKPLPTPPEGE